MFCRSQRPGARPVFKHRRFRFQRSRRQVCESMPARGILYLHWCRIRQLVLMPF